MRAILALVLAACSATEASPTGIATLRLEDSAERTRVVAFDALGAEVGRLELVRGSFVLSDGFEADYDAAAVVGRKLDVSVGGDRLVWQTSGYAPTLHLPPHPPGHEALAAFLDDARVRTVLEAWLIGFDAAQAAPTYVAGSEPGTFVADCGGLPQCGPPAGGKVPSTCGGSGIASSAIRISRAAPVGEDLIAQCCPPLSGFPHPSFSIKVCPMTGPDSSCGTARNGGCKGCPGYPTAADSFCHVAFHGSLDYCYASTGPKPATEIAQADVPDFWPPNGRVVTVDVVSCMQSVFDPCNPSLTAAEIVAAPSFRIDAVGSDEPGGEIAVTGPHSVSFRVARSGGAETGRSYFVDASYVNELGVTSPFECRFHVPHDRGAHAAD